ncbi:MAG: alpha/beta hydrolase, partial [Parabacteroides sp.]|nr:alpha/beta hydrolase [Parabacteroides sp.]
MKKLILLFIAMLCSWSIYAWERETIWPKGKMPHRQDHQIAAMTDEAGQPDFKADKHRVAYLEWFDQPDEKVRNGACMILISGGSYEVCCDVDLIKRWREELTKQGIQCVNFVY